MGRMVGATFSWRQSLPLLVLLLATSATASGGFEQFAKRQNDFPDATAITSVVGASSSRASSSSTSATPSSTTASSSPATQTTGTAVAPAAAGQDSPLPSLFGVGAPALIVPDTSSAPFQQKSSLPEGTVFIVVGAVLGFLGMCVLAWRGMVAYSLRRSVQRAAHTAYAPDAKSGYDGKTSGYPSMYGASNMSLEMLSSQKTAYGGAGAISHSREPSSSKQRHPKSRNVSASAASLFFSPTATNNAGTASNRASTFLPAGYYAAGAALGAGPVAQGYGRVDSMESGLDSPGLRMSQANMSRPTSSGTGLQSAAAGGRHQHRPSASRFASTDYNDPSSLGVQQQGGGAGTSGGRTPSAYMEDVLSEHGYGPRERF